MSIHSSIVSKLAQEFIEAETLSRPLEPISTQYQGMTETDAYDIEAEFEKLGVVAINFS